MAPFAQPAAMAAAFVCGALWLASPPSASAQLRTPSGAASPQGGFPDASFDTAFRKYVPPQSVFSPFYSWDAHMALDATVYRWNPGAVTVRALVQTIGTENLGEKVSVGAAGYLLGFSYVHAHSDEVAISAGLTHVSSHLTRDLDDKLDEETVRGTRIPVVVDPSQYNVLFIKGSRKFPEWPLTPVFEVAFQPVNFRFSGGRLGDVRPVYVATRSTVWHGRKKSLVMETDHEIGRNAFSQFVLLLELYARAEAEGRLKVFVAASPGQEVRVSPNIGAIRGGIALGVRLRFRA